MKRRLLGALVCTARMAHVAQAQDRSTVEPRGGATPATETLTTTDLKVGGGWDWQHHRA